MQLEQKVLPRRSLPTASQAQSRRNQWEVDKHVGKRLYDGGGPACADEMTCAFLVMEGRDCRLAMMFPKHDSAFASHDFSGTVSAYLLGSNWHCFTKIVLGGMVSADSPPGLEQKEFRGRKYFFYREKSTGIGLIGLVKAAFPALVLGMYVDGGHSPGGG